MKLWTRNRPFETVAPPFQIIPTKTLYYYDGPVDFTAVLPFSFPSPFTYAVLTKIDDFNNSEFWTAAPTDDETMALVLADKLSFRGAFIRDHLWILETVGLVIRKSWPCARADLSEAFLPGPGCSIVSLRRDLPDTL